MRKIFILFLLSTCALTGFAQTNVYHPFPEDSALWIVDWTHQSSAPVERDVYIMHGDTVINSISYNKIYHERNIYMGPYSPANVLVPYGYLGAMRQDSLNKRVYYRSDTMVADTLLYDFNLTIGDTLPKTYMTSSPPNNIVIAIDSVLMNGYYYKRFVFSGSSVYGHLIEGIGSDCGFFEMFGHWEGGPSLDCFRTTNISESGNPNGYLYMRCGYYSFPTSDNEIVTDLHFSFYPNPSKGIINISFPDKISQIVISDILGHELYKSSASSLFNLSLDLSDRPKGIYFVKVVDEKGNFGVKKIVLQ